MKQVNLYEAKTHLSALVDEAKAGGEIIIAKNGKPAARLVAIEPVRAKQPPRRFGFWAKYKDWRPPDVFPETSQEEIDLWENGPVYPEGMDKPE